MLGFYQTNYYHPSHHTSTKSLHQTDSSLVDVLNTKLEAHLYLDGKTLTHSPLQLFCTLHLHLPRRAWLKALICLTSRLPLSFGKHTSSQLTQATFPQSSSPPEKILLNTNNFINHTYLFSIDKVSHQLHCLLNLLAILLHNSPPTNNIRM